MIYKKDEIRQAILNAGSGISKYLEIMDMFHQVDVSKSNEFQKKFNAFYRVRQRNQDWYVYYYSLMEHSKSMNVDFNYILTSIQNQLGRYEPSFSSKLLATINPNMPIWDSFVLKNCNFKPPSYGANNKLTKAMDLYSNLCLWYESFLHSTNATNFISEFDTLVPKHGQVSNLKKIDFILWQLNR